MFTAISGIGIAILAGWLAGALVNYLADVLQADRALTAPACQHCGSRRQFWALAWQRRCPICHSPLRQPGHSQELRNLLGRHS